MYLQSIKINPKGYKTYFELGNLYQYKIKRYGSSL